MKINVDPERVLRPVPAFRGVHLGDSHDPFIEEDIARFKEEVGVTGVRIGIMPTWLSDEDPDGWKEDGFRYVGNLLEWCGTRGIRCVLDLHNAHGRLFGGDPRLWREEPFQDRFVQTWEELARRFRGHPAVGAYELLNEPEPPDRDFDVWNRLHKRTTAAIREIDPYQTIIIDSIGYANPSNFSGLVPNGDPNTVYSFHNYAPGPYHAQKRANRKDKSTYYYPGFIPEVAPERPLDFDQAHAGTEEGMVWNRRQLVECWGEVFAFQDRHGVPLYCGEFGCVSDVPEMTDMVYLMDEISIFHEHGIGWAMYNGMWREDNEAWKTRFDCNLYACHSPEKTVYRFSRKIALIEFFCRTEGDVLALSQPEDEWIGLYGVRTPDRGVSLLVSNKDRHKAKTVTVSLAGLPPVWPVALKTMVRGDEGFVRQPSRELRDGRLGLDLPPLSLALLAVPAPGLRAWH